MQPGAGQPWVNSSGGWLVVALALATLHKAPFYYAVRSMATRTVLLCPEVPRRGGHHPRGVGAIHLQYPVALVPVYYLSFLCHR